MAKARQPDLEAFYDRHPDLEEELRGHFRRLGLLDDPFRDAAQFRRESPPWQLLPGQEPSVPEPPARPPPGTFIDKEMLLENLVRPVAGSARWSLLRRRSRVVILLAMAFVVGWLVLVALDGFSGWGALRPTGRARIEGLASLAVLASGWPAAREDLLTEGVGAADRCLRIEGDRWEILWIRFLFLQELGRDEEAGRDLSAIPAHIGRRLLYGEKPSGRTPEDDTISALAALGEALGRRPEKAQSLLQEAGIGGDGLLLPILRAALGSAWRRDLFPRLLKSQDPWTRLLGAAWGTALKDPAAREALRDLPLDGVAVARMLVELGEEELFLRNVRPARIDLASLRIHVLCRLGRRSEAIRFGEDLLASNPDSFDLHLGLARLCREEKYPVRAAGHLKTATQLRPSSVEPMREWLRLAGECTERPEIASPCAEMFLRRVSAQVRGILEREVDDNAVEGGPERLLVSGGFGLPREEEARSAALAALQRASTERPQDEALHFLLGRALFANGSWADATARFAAAETRADPLDRPAIRAWKAAALRRAGRLQEAGAEDSLLEEAARDPEAQGLDEALRALGDPGGPEARRFLEKAIADRPGSDAALVRLARITTGNGPPGGDPARTLEILDGRVDPNQSGTALLLEKVRALEWQGQWTPAAEILAEAIVREPRRPELRARAGWAWLIAGDHERAVAALGLEGSGSAVKGMPAGVEELLVRAFIALAEDDANGAEAWFTAAVGAGPTDPRTWFLRGYFRRLQGGSAAADQDWEKTVGLAGVGGSGRGRPASGWIGTDEPDPAAWAWAGLGVGAALEAEALPWMLALIHGARGDAEAVRWYVPLGPSAGRTLPGAFLRAAALGAAGDRTAAEAEALAYRARRFPIFAWQGLDPWVGTLFR